MSLVLLRIGLALAGGLVCYFLIRRQNKTPQNQFSNVGGAFRGENIDSCLVCLDEFECGSSGQIATLPCNHKFHKTCITEAFNFMEGTKCCPICRQVVREEFIKKHI